jgi:outer membrane protein TolC
MRKHLLILSVVFAVLFSINAFAAETEQVSVALSFDEAAATALDNNFDIKLARLTWENAQKNYDRAVFVGDEDEIESAAEALEKANADYETTANNLLLDVERLYMDLFAANERLAEQKATLAEAERRYELEKARYQVGLISALDLEKAANTFFSATNSYNNQVSTTQTSQLRFNELLGLPLSTIVTLKGELKATFSPLKMTLEEALAIATQNSDSYAQALEALETAKANVAAGNNEFTPAVEYEKLLFEQQKAEINLEKAKQKLYFDVRSSLITLQQRENTVELRQRELSVAETNYKAAQVQFNAGSISEDTLQERADAVSTAQQSLDDAIWDHVSAKRDFLRLIGTPEPVWTVVSDEK